MEETQVTLKIIQDDFKVQVNPSELENVIFVEDAHDSHCVSQITLSGQYNQVYNVVTGYICLTLDRVLVNGNILIFCVESNLVIVDLKQNKLQQVIEFKYWYSFGIFKFKSGYFLYGEEINYFIDEKFDIIWDNSCCDVFVNPKVEKNLEIFDDYITVYDWCGYKHYYNESGEFKAEYFPQYG